MLMLCVTYDQKISKKKKKEKQTKHWLLQTLFVCTQRVSPDGKAAAEVEIFLQKQLGHDMIQKLRKHCWWKPSKTGSVTENLRNCTKVTILNLRRGNFNLTFLTFLGVHACRRSNETQFKD